MLNKTVLKEMILSELERTGSFRRTATDRTGKNMSRIEELAQAIANSVVQHIWDCLEIGNPMISISGMHQGHSDSDGRHSHFSGTGEIK